MALSVASAAFFRLECSHAQLFQPEYKRSNRTKGLKILRCFPHCCPDHIDRSYCGSSLSVRVELEAQDVDDPPTESVALFARFEALGEVSLKPGECVQVARMMDATQSESNPEAQWVAGLLDRPSKLVTTIRAPGAPTEESKPLVFHLNSKTFSRWYYDWESGANKAQRLMKHVFKAYVVERCAVDQDDNFVAVDSPQASAQFYRVLHVVTSPEFTVISYRRAQSENYQGVLLTPHEEVPRHEYAGEYSRGGESPRVGNGAYVHSQLSTRGSHLHLPMKAGSASAKCQAKRQRTSHPQLNAVDASILLEDKLRWEHANLSTVVVSRNLALVYSFLRWAPLSVYASFVDELVHLLHHSLQVSLTGFPNEISRLNCFSKLIFDQVEADEGTAVASSFVHGSRSRGGAPTVLPQKMEALLHVLTQVMMWLSSMETRQWMRSFLSQHAESVLNKRALRASFVLFVQQLEDRLNTQVLERTVLRSLNNLAEEVLAAVYSYEYFHARRPRVREILSGQNFAGWSTFVAQMRETYINVSTCPGVPHALARCCVSLSFDQAHPPRNDAESAWNAEWILDVDGAIWKFSDNVSRSDFVGGSAFGCVGHVGDDEGAVSLFTLFEVVSQVVRLEVAIDVQARLLHARSTLGVAGPLDCMRLVLDGKDRVFSMSPNGMTSGIDAGAFGDYIAEVQVDQSGRLVVYLQIFKWAAREDGLSYHVRVRIECWHSRRLCINGEVLVTTAPSSFTSEEVAYLGEMSLRSKREAVERSFAWQLRENSTAKWTTPWKELGRFRLSYLKA